MYYQGFPIGQESATFRDQGAKIHPLSRDKGTTGQAQNVAMGQNVRAGTAYQNPGQDVGRDNHYFFSYYFLF